VARLQTSAAFRKYLKEKVHVEFDGIDQSEGLIAQATDEVTELVDEAATLGNLLTIHGFGLKIEADQTHHGDVGLFFVPAGSNGTPVKAEILAVNEPKTLKAIVPASLTAGALYRLKIVTQSSAKHGSALLKNTREVHSEFTLTTQA
jgi:hypothetical protein